MRTGWTQYAIRIISYFNVLSRKTQKQMKENAILNILIYCWTIAATQKAEGGLWTAQKQHGYIESSARHFAL